MIDLKLNELPVDSKLNSGGEIDASDSEALARVKETRQGLSINDTIAHDANLSVGSRGADTSGVEAGTGAGAGLTQVTPGGESPAPQIVPGAQGTGTTALAASPQTGTSSDHFTDSVSAGTDLSSDEIAARAYQCWHERGCPNGSPEVDWHRAERELRTRTRAASA